MCYIIVNIYKSALQVAYFYFIVFVLDIEGEQLEEAIIKQVDYYFSRQNLATDAYLVSQMDAEMWVPISIIAGFKVF